MNLFDLFVKIGIDDQVTDKLPGIGNAVKTGLATAGKVAAVGVGAATAAVGALTKTAVDGYAEYEQLVGGVETLFDTSADAVNDYAQQAYKTAGMSANEYMNTITGFSASLLQSLGGDTAAAAEYGNLAVIDMADNANKMGTSIESIQNAYQGFAKQNYTMLDNLKLGYGGTKEEMERLIEDANRVREANGEMADLSIDSFADVVQAIHTMQEEMGIADATAQEAEGTISGSAATMKAAWENLVVGLADENANVDELLDNFLDSVETTAGNILPVVERVLGRIFQTLADNGPEIIAAGARLLGQLAAGAIKAIPDVVASIPTIVMAIVDGFADAAPEFMGIGEDIVRGLWEGIKNLSGWIGRKVSGFLDNLFHTAEENEEINSPSKKWAEIGKYDALGYGVGWDKQISSVQRDISNGLNFGTASVDYSASTARRMGSMMGGAFGGQPITIVVQSVLDGRVIGETAYQYSREQQRAYGW